ncbi:MAG TPA: sigma factor-like helix-turn-helix DNA-binding protein [bacterium]|nr:sigma factor-like helix-turn-helix DNA-binding protein [bacterium]
MENLLKTLLKEQKNKELIKLNAVEIVEGLFNELQERERDILSRRFALKDEGRQTLDEIGKLHNLTRERVRQIERASLKKIKKIDDLDSHLESVKVAVSKLIEEHGGIMEKDFLLDILAVMSYRMDANLSYDKNIYKNYLEFILSELLNEDIERVDKSDKFDSFFKLKNEAVDYLENLVVELKEKLNGVKKTLLFEELVEVLKGLGSFSSFKEKILSKNELNLKDIFKDDVFPEWADIIDKNKPLYSLMQAAKGIKANKFGAWGSEDWSEVKPKRIADKIFLVLKNENNPLHFSDIAKKINEVGFDHKKVSPGSVHNELILDDRYILVDRGVYALKEWQK